MTSADANASILDVMLYHRTQEQVSDIMRRVKSEDTTPEVAFRKALWAQGVRYRLHSTALPGKPDIVLSRSRLVIFIDGDFWHGNQWRSRGHISLEAQFVASPRASYWVPKIDHNMRRDRQNTAALLAGGWRVLRFWESDVKSDIQACLSLTVNAVEGKVETTRLARLPRQAAIVFSKNAGMTQGLELAGWTVKPSDDISSVGLAAADCTTFRPHVSRFTNTLARAGAAKPPLILLQLRLGDQSRLAGLFRDLNNLGYLCDAFVLNTAGRLNIVGSMDAPGSSSSPAESETRPQDLIDFIARQRDIRWFHRDIPPLEPLHCETCENDAAAIRWIADKYLNPLINTLIHSRCLYP